MTRERIFSSASAVAAEESLAWLSLAGGMGSEGMISVAGDMDVSGESGGDCGEELMLNSEEELLAKRKEECGGAMSGAISGAWVGRAEDAGRERLRRWRGFLAGGCESSAPLLDESAADSDSVVSRAGEGEVARCVESFRRRRGGAEVGVCWISGGDSSRWRFRPALDISIGFKLIETGKIDFQQG
jgi:hypothetical protein